MSKTPEEFKKAMEKVIEGCTFPGNNGEYYDPESGHEETDNLLLETLIELGYEEGVELYKKQIRWFN